jgi:murein DD-endopeptidase MepM/ murein hydrolase activator NlpD
MLERKANGIAAALLLVCGLALCGCATPEPDYGWPPVTYRDVTVHSGDTLSEIAGRNRVSENTLVAVNGISDPNLIRVGQVLRVPQVASEPEHVAQAHVAVRRSAPVYVSALPAPRAAKTDETPRPRPDYSADSIAFEWPVEGRIISPFGATASGQRNDGINIATQLGEPIHAAAAGIVTYAGDELKGYGNLVLIRHDDGYVTAYAHAQSITVARGQRVAKGQVIGYAGHTGDVKTPQLQFEIRKGVEPVDPKPLLMASSS